MPFSSLQLHPSLLQAVKDAGYTEPTPIQTSAIPIVITGKDVIGIAQTGTGKTAAFTLPILSRLLDQGAGRGIRVLILAPTRELVVQIEENVRAYAQHTSVTMATVFGGVGERPQMAALRKGVDIVIACPGRLLDLMQQPLVLRPEVRQSLVSRYTVRDLRVANQPRRRVVSTTPMT